MCKSSRINAYIYNWCRYIQHVHLLFSLLQSASNSNNAMSKNRQCTLWSMDHHRAWSTTWRHYSGESIYLFFVACYNLCRISKEKISNQNFWTHYLFYYMYLKSLEYNSNYVYILYVVLHHQWKVMSLQWGTFQQFCQMILYWITLGPKYVKFHLGKI